MILEPTKELWALVNEDNEIMTSCKLDQYQRHRGSKRVLVYASEKNANAAWKHMSFKNEILRVKRIL